MSDDLAKGNYARLDSAYDILAKVWAQDTPIDGAKLADIKRQLRAWMVAISNERIEAEQNEGAKT